MEKSAHFRAPEIGTESHTDTKNGEGGVKIAISTTYLPAEPLERGGE
jgi:hypothetical protein